jgi:hypothetical protein
LKAKSDKHLFETPKLVKILSVALFLLTLGIVGKLLFGTNQVSQTRIPVEAVISGNEVRLPNTHQLFQQLRNRTVYLVTQGDSVLLNSVSLHSDTVYAKGNFIQSGQSWKSQPLWLLIQREQTIFQVVSEVR